MCVVAPRHCIPNLRGSICWIISVLKIFIIVIIPKKKNDAVFGVKINAAIESVKIFTAGDSARASDDRLSARWLRAVDLLLSAQSHNYLSVRWQICPSDCNLHRWLAPFTLRWGCHLLPVTMLSPPCQAGGGGGTAMAGICGANAAFRQRQIQPEFENSKEREEERRAGGLGVIVALILN